MHAGIGGDELLDPVVGRPLGIVLLQRFPVVLALVAEQPPELLERRRIPDQTVPVVVRDLVPEMTEQRAVGLAHLAALPLAFGIVCLGEVDA